MIKTFIFLFLSVNNSLICSIMVLCLCFLWNLTFFPRKTPLVAQMVKRLAYSAGDLGLIPGLGRSSGEEMATHSSTLAWKIPWTEEHGRLQSVGSLESDTTELLHFHALEKEMAIHSSTFVWKIPWTEEHGRLQSMGSQRI